MNKIVSPLSVELDKIPGCLKRFRSWVYWRNIESRGKVPYQDINRLAKTNDPSTWRSFDQIRDWNIKNFSGIGFVLTANPFTIIDLDKCIIDNRLSRFAKKVIEYFDSYTEISPSGTGLHIVVTGKIEKAVKQKNIEVYDKGRYMCFTGHIYLDRIVREQQKKLDKLIKKYHNKERVKFRENYIFSSNGKFIMPKEIIKKGERNNSLSRWAGVLNMKSITDEEYWQYLFQINSQCCAPPMADSEVRAIGKSIRRYKK